MVLLAEDLASEPNSSEFRNRGFGCQGSVIRVQDLRHYPQTSTP